MHTSIKNAYNANNSSIGTSRPTQNGKSNAKSSTAKSSVGIFEPNKVQTIQSSPDFREQFLNFIGQSCPGIRQLKFKKKRRSGKFACVYYIVRGSYGQRELYSRGRCAESASLRFLNEIQTKVSF